MIAKKSNAKYIFEVHELWPLSPVKLGGIPKYHPFVTLMQHGENFAYENACKVISMVPKTKDHMKSHGLDLKKWHYIPNRIAVNGWGKDIVVEIPYKELFDQLKAENKFIIVYLGGHSVSNALVYIIEASNKLKNDNNIVFVLVGNGTEKENFKSFSKNKIPQFLEQCDALILSWHKSPLYQYGISPNKIFDYMSSGIPVIGSKFPLWKTIVDGNKCGLTVNPNDISIAIKKLLTIYKELLK